MYSQEVSGFAEEHLDCTNVYSKVRCHLFGNRAHVLADPYFFLAKASTPPSSPARPPYLLHLHQLPSCLVPKHSQFKTGSPPLLLTRPTSRLLALFKPSPNRAEWSETSSTTFLLSPGRTQSSLVLISLVAMPLRSTKSTQLEAGEFSLLEFALLARNCLFLPLMKANYHSIVTAPTNGAAGVLPAVLKVGCAFTSFDAPADLSAT